MSSRYQVLDNRPIDQWKVTELKDELRRRKLPIKGLKEDLVKRLDEALRIERENEEKANNLGSSSESEDMVKDEKALPDVVDASKDLLDESVDENRKIGNIPDPIDINDSKAPSGGPLDSQVGVILDGNESSRMEEEFVSDVSNVPTTVVVTETVVSKVSLSEHGVQNIETEGEDGNLQSQLKDEETMPPMENEDSMHDLESNPLYSPLEDLMTDSYSSNNQALEAVVTSDSITTDTVTIEETIELKANVSAENLQLELDLEPERMEPSSITADAAGEKSHLVDVDEEQREKTAFVGEKDDSCGTEAGLGKKIEVADGYSEKLNLDRSSGDDSMEEDALESKQVESRCSPDEGEDMIEKSEVTIIKQETYTSVIRKETYDEAMGDRKDPNLEKKAQSSLLAEKRKLPDHAAVVNEPGKRQRTWNSENIKIPESKGSNITPSTTPKEVSLSIDVKQRSLSAVNEAGAAKERVVPPSPKPPSNSLRIDNFLRPFTLKAVQELLGKTGNVTSFWMDHIKTHCYVTFSSVEEAVETRNAVYNLQWPPNGGRLLAAEFVDPQEVKKRAEVPQPPTPTTTSAAVAAPARATLQTHPSPRFPRQQLPPPQSLPPPPPLIKAAQVMEPLPLPPPPAIEEKTEPPIVTLDDIFRKTKATPRIYYLPLSESQVAAKLGAEGKGTQI